VVKKDKAVKAPEAVEAPRAKVAPGDLLPSGSTMLNLAVAGTPRGAIAPGSYVLFVGDSQTGKTFMALGMLAEAAQHSKFRNHHLVYDNVENGAMMDMKYYFGATMARRLQGPPNGTSQTVEGFYDNVDKALAAKRPVIYVLDSMDSLTSVAEAAKVKANTKARAAGEKGKGDYGDGKSQVNSRRLRLVVGALERSESVLVVIAQTRDNIDAGLFGPKKKRSGGHALDFYAHVALWASQGKAITRTVRGQSVVVGHETAVRVTKNRVTGRQRVVPVPFLLDHGVDDLGGVVMWMVKWKFWTLDDGTLTAPEFGYVGTVGKFVDKVHEEGLMVEVHRVVGQAWATVEAAAAVARPRRYQ
jgi:hypothetical protein